MVYIKVLDRDGALVGVEALADPGWVRYDPIHHRLLRCGKDEAGGVVSEDASTVYNYGNVGVHAELTAVTIMPAEYDTLQPQIPDPEDDDPEIPDGSDPEEKPMTRAELTEKVEALEKANTLLTGMLLENREEEMKASRAYSPGDLIVVNGTLYKAVSRIANGAALTKNTNVIQTTLAAEIAAAKS